MTLLATFIDAETKDYIAINGQYQQKNALLTEGYTRSVTPLGSYKFDTSFGNELMLNLNRRIQLTESQITTMQNNALQPMVSSGRALSVSSTVPAITNNQIYVVCNIVDTDKNVFTLTIPYTIGSKNA